MTSEDVRISTSQVVLTQDVDAQPRHLLGQTGGFVGDARCAHPARVVCQAYSSAMPSARLTLPANVSSVPTARHFVESILSGWGLKELGWVATLIVSELAANAALHARGEHFSVHVSSDADGVRLEIHDTSLRLPQQRSYGRDATTGRGLKLVSELAEDWGVDPTDSGKTVWAVLRPKVAGGDDDEADVDAILAAFAEADDVLPVVGARDEPRVHAVHLPTAA
jgi:anti-sigma regulatory factor (Ser/Thr protein kinase)